MKIPGLGTDASLPTPVAFAMLGLGLVYFFGQYILEYRFVVAMNAPGAIDGLGTGLREKLRAMIDAAEAQAEHAKQQFEAIDNHAEGVAKETRLFTNLESYSANEVAQHLNTLHRVMAANTGIKVSLEASLREYAYAIEKQIKSFERLSSSIDRSLKINFHLFDVFVPSAMTLIAAALCVWSIVGLPR